MGFLVRDSLTKLWKAEDLEMERERICSFLATIIVHRQLVQQPLTYHVATPAVNSHGTFKSTCWLHAHE